MLKQLNFFHSQPSTLPKEALGNFYISTTFGLSFTVSSVAPTRSFTSYAHLIKVCSFWSRAFLALCSSDRKCARESTFFSLPGKSNFQAINLFLQKLDFPLIHFTRSRGLRMRRKGMHMTKMNRLYQNWEP